jgi:tetratricopeptide (TPR) repeat protein
MKKWVLPGLCLAALYAWAYAPALHGDFLWDDNAHVSENISMRSLHGLIQIWTEPGSSVQHYPLTFSAFWLEYHLWGLHVVPYHVTALGLHALNALLFFLFLRRLSCPGAAFAAALFLLHPVHTESVAWITEMKNQLSGTLFLLAGHAFWSGGFFYVASFVLFTMALLAKTAVCPWPIAMGLLLWARRRLTPTLGILLVPFVLLSVVSGLITMRLEQHTYGAMGAGFDFSFLQRLANAARAVWFYLGKLVWPHPLIFMYPNWPKGIGGLAVLYLLALAGLTGVGIYAAKKGNRGPVTAWLYYLACLGPALGFFNMFTMNFTWVADHFQYMASLGPIAIAAASLTYGAQRLRLRSWICVSAASTVLVLLAFRTHTEAYKYHDMKSLWLDTLAKNPACEMAENNLAHHYYFFENDPAQAEVHIRAAIALRPESKKYRLNLAKLLEDTGRLREARAEYEKIVQLDPADVYVLERYKLFLLRHKEPSSRRG